MSVETIHQPRPTDPDPRPLKAPYTLSDLPALRTKALEQSGTLAGAWKWIENHPNARPETLSEAHKRFEQLLTGYSTTCSVIRRLERLEARGAGK